jgi:hypothetical protein
MTVECQARHGESAWHPHASQPPIPLFFQPKGGAADATMQNVDPAGRGSQPPVFVRTSQSAPGAGIRGSAKGEVEPGCVRCIPRA